MLNHCRNIQEYAGNFAWGTSKAPDEYGLDDYTARTIQDLVCIGMQHFRYINRSNPRLNEILGESKDAFDVPIKQVVQQLAKSTGIPLMTLVHCVRCGEAYIYSLISITINNHPQLDRLHNLLGRKISALVDR
jgi:hypothetical protein